MTPELNSFITAFLDQHRIMTIATNRPDGWPQATTVNYVSEGLLLYSFIASVSQKAANLRRDDRVSIAITGDFVDPLKIQGLSMAARAETVSEVRDFERICDLFLKRIPEYGPLGRPNPVLSPLMRITPEWISVVDYTKRFGHTDLVKVSRQDLRPSLATCDHRIESHAFSRFA